MYSSKQKKGQSSNPAVKIATAGIAVGIAVMIISVAVVFGFKHTIQQKVVGFGSHITVGNFLSMHGFEQAPVIMGDSILTAIKNIDGVKSVSPYAETQGILKTESDFLGVAIKGLSENFDTLFLSKNLIAGRMPKLKKGNDEEGSQNEILISKSQADKLSLEANQKVFAYFIDGEDVRTRKFLIAGIYQTNLTAFDEQICFTDFRTVQKINGYKADEADGAEVLINDFTKLEQVEEHFVKQINRRVDKNGETYSSKTITELHPGIFSWLDLLDLNVWIILALMVAVAGFTMISGLLIIILERANLIGLLKALGMRNTKVRHTFIWLAMFIVCKGLIIGNILAFALMLSQSYFGFIKLDPKVYYVAEVPLEINIPIIVLINICTLIVCSLILVLPSMLVSRISPAKVMRYE